MNDRGEQDEANFKEWKEWMKKHEADYYKIKDFKKELDEYWKPAPEGPINPSCDCDKYCPRCGRRYDLRD